MINKNQFTQTEKSWIMYDWANSVYATIIMAAVFNAFFTGLCDDPRGGDFWWSVGTTAAMLLTAVLAPIVGAFADYKGHKKKLFVAFWVLGLSCTALCAVFNSWQALLVGYILSSIGFNGSNLLYDSFLPDVAAPGRMDRVSGWGYAMGYIGGSTIPFLLSIALIQFGPRLGLETAAAVKISVLLTVVWWGLFSAPFLKNVKQRSFVEKPPEGVLRHTFGNIRAAAESILKNKGLALFILAYFFYIDGVGSIIRLATSYGTELGLGMLGMITALFVMQLVAFPFSILFGKFAKKIGSLNMLTAAVSVYIVICVVGFLMGYLIEFASPAGKETAIARSTMLFWLLAIMVGTVQGGTQALSRSYFSKLVPPEKSGEYFGFFEIFGKFAAIMGPLLYALTKGITGYSSFAISSVVLLFGAALFILMAGRKHMVRNEDAHDGQPASLGA